jgi:hypothetical protein
LSRPFPSASQPTTSKARAMTVNGNAVRMADPRIGGCESLWLTMRGRD